MGTVKYLWLDSGTGKWHAWPKGARHTLCGRVNVEHLRTHPAAAITALAPAPEASVCAVCGKKSGHVAQVVAVPDGVTRAWIGFLKRYLLRAHITLADDTVRLLAERLADVGSPDDQDARDVFDQVRSVLLRPMRISSKRRDGRAVTLHTIPHLKEALNALPPKTGALQKVATAMRCWRAITRRDPSGEKFSVQRVVETMLQVPSVEQYITHLNGEGLPNLAAMFHPNTLARAKRDTALRGLFAGSPEYWSQTEGQLNIITD